MTAKPRARPICWLLLPIGPSLEIDVLRLTNDRKRCYKLRNDLIFTQGHSLLHSDPSHCKEPFLCTSVTGTRFVLEQLPRMLIQYQRLQP